MRSFWDPKNRSREVILPVLRMCFSASLFRTVFSSISVLSSICPTLRSYRYLRCFKHFFVFRNFRKVYEKTSKKNMKIHVKSTPKSTKNQSRERIAKIDPQIYRFFRSETSRGRFSPIFGSRPEPKIHQKCGRERDPKKSRKKKRQHATKTRGVGVMRWASGEVRRGHTSYDSLRRIQIRIQIKLFSTPRRPSAKGGGFPSLRLMPPTPRALGFEILRFRFENSGLKI